MLGTWSGVVDDVVGVDHVRILVCDAVDDGLDLREEHVRQEVDEEVDERTSNRP